MIPSLFRHHMAAEGAVGFTPATGGGISAE